MNFGIARWEQVIKNLQIAGDQSKNRTPTKMKSSRYNPYGSEGSEEHRNLIKLIIKNPSLLGISDVKESFTEYPLKSGDSVDAVFYTENSIFAVEAKSRRSGIDDIERGLFQCIKYKAVIEAENKIENTTKEVVSYLVIENEFPRRLESTKKELSIKVFEKFPVT